jgi:hypothetical protein
MINKYSRVVFQLALMACIGLIATYLFTEFRITFSSDDAVRSVLVKIADRRHGVLVADWVYANGDLFLATPYLINLVFSKFLVDTFLANTLSSFVGYLILLGCFYKFCSSMEWKYREIPLLSTIFLASGISAANLEFAVAQGIYSAYSGLALLAAVLLIDKTTIERKLSVRLIGCLCLSFILTLSNPKRALIQFVLPALMAWVFTFFTKEKRDSSESLAHRLFTRSIVFALIGYVAAALIYYLVLLPGVMNFDSAINIGPLSPAETINRIFALPSAWIAYLQPQLDPRGYGGFALVVEYVSGFIAIGLAVGPLLSLKSIRQMSKVKCFALAFGLIQCALAVGAMVTNRNLFIGFGEVRYLSIGLMCFIPFSLEVMGRYAQRARMLRSVVLIFLIYSIAIASLWVWPGRAVEAERRAIYSQRLEMINTLKSNGVCVALATYWNSYVNSVAGNFDVLFYPVEVPNFVQLQPHHSYRGPALIPCARSALLLSDTELTPALREMIKLQFGPSAMETSVAGYHALIFDRDIYSELVRDQALQHQLLQNTSLPKENISIEVSKTLFERCSAKSGCPQDITVRNLGTALLTSNGGLPLRLGIHGLDQNSRIVENDAGRINFLIPLKPGNTEALHFELPYSDRDVDKYQLCIVQDGVGWYCDRTSTKL